jgi:REP element-mobilizing transposase RayT
VRPSRLNSFAYIERYRFFPTVGTGERRRHFVSGSLVADIRLQVPRTAGDEGFSISAYCFMPDHLPCWPKGCRCGAP